MRNEASNRELETCEVKRKSCEFINEAFMLIIILVLMSFLGGQKCLIFMCNAGLVESKFWSLLEIAKILLLLLQWLLKPDRRIGLTGHQARNE